MRNFLGLFSMVIMTMLLWVNATSCSSDIEEEGPKFPVVEFYYKGNCIGIINENNQYGSFEIPDSLIGNVGEKIEIEAKVISGGGVSLNNSSMESGSLYLPKYIKKTESRRENVANNSKQYSEYDIYSLEIIGRTIIPRAIELEFEAWDNNGPSRETIISYFYITIYIRGERDIHSFASNYDSYNSIATFKTIHLGSNEHELFFSSPENAHIIICKKGTEFDKQEWIGWMHRSHIEWNDQQTTCYYSIIVSQNDTGASRTGSLVLEDGPYKKTPVVIIEQDAER